MKKLLLLLALITQLVACRDDDPVEPISYGDDGIIVPEPVQASTFYPLEVGNRWSYRQYDSVNRVVDSFDILEQLDSCCHYINLYRMPDYAYMGWKWREPQADVMYANGGGQFFTTEYIDEPKGRWEKINSSTSENEAVTEIASGLFEITTPAGTFDCIKTRLTVTFPNPDERRVYLRYHGLNVGMVRERVVYWDDYGTEPSIRKTSVTDLLSHSLK